VGQYADTRTVGRLTRLVLVVLLAGLMVLQSGLVLGQVTFGATLTVLNGRVSVVHSNGSAVQPAPSGMSLDAGDRVATVGKSGALITFFNGTEIELGADTTVAVGEASKGTDDIVAFLIQIILGNTVHRVTPMSNASSSYKILAGNSVIEVRGTTIGAGVNDQGDVTAYLQNGKASFDGYTMQNGEACTLSAAGAFECQNQNGKNIWSGTVDGVTNGSNKGNLSNTSQPNDDKDTKPTDSTPTPTSTPVPPTATPTPTATPEEECSRQCSSPP
jgi:hypothetical protein